VVAVAVVVVVGVIVVVVVVMVGVVVVVVAVVVRVVRVVVVLRERGSWGRFWASSLFSMVVVVWEGCDAVVLSPGRMRISYVGLGQG
jgi:hypothetical protein